MKTKILVTALVAIASLTAPSARANDKDFLVGTWEVNTTMNGYMERGVLTLRADGTGEQDRFAVGQEKMHSDFKWKLIKGGITFSAVNNIYIRLRTMDFRHIVLTPANALLRPIGPDLEYERQVPEDAITSARPFTIIGLWQTTENYNGYFIHHVISLSADGTGTESINYSNAFGQSNNEVAFRWTYANNVVRRVAPNGEPAFANIRIIDRTHVVIKHIGGFPIMNGGEFKYELQEHQNDEGC